MIKKYRRVRDHCHYTANYRGPLHNIYNLKHSIPKEVGGLFGDSLCRGRE